MALIFASTLGAQEPTPKHKDLDPLWMKVSIHAQNAAHRIEMQGADTGAPNPKAYRKEISAINST